LNAEVNEVEEVKEVKDRKEGAAAEPKRETHLRLRKADRQECLSYLSR
jgi:hypothetical protein